MSSTSFLCTIGVGAAVTLAPLANADIMLQPVSVSTAAVQFTPIGNTINQSGLSATYTSGVTDYDTFVASSEHINSNAAKWLSNLAVPKLVTFDLGAEYSIAHFVFWATIPDNGIRDFELFSDSNDDFGDGGLTSLGTFLGETPPAPNDGLAQPFSFTPTDTRYVHLQINSVYDAAPDLSIGEFAFGAVPTPGTFAVLGLAGALGVRRRR